jgi:hypothetical protein
VATLWATAYSVAQYEGAARKFYMIQDFEPMFYPAGTLYALAEESYRLGLYGLCNTDHMLRLYEERYGGRGTSFEPAVDPTIFHAEGRNFDRTLDQVAAVLHFQPVVVQRRGDAGHAQRFGAHAGAARAGADVGGRADQADGLLGRCHAFRCRSRTRRSGWS